MIWSARKAGLQSRGTNTRKARFFHSAMAKPLIAILSKLPSLTRYPVFVFPVAGVRTTHRALLGIDAPRWQRLSFAIQLAKYLGARVITTASAASLTHLRDIGADEVIDYNSTDFSKVVSNCDAVFDTVGGDVALRSFAVLKPGGRAAFIASGAQPPKSDRSDVTALRPAIGRDRAHLDRVAQLYEAGAVSAPTITLYRLSDAVEALRVSEARHLKGKLVFEVR